MQPSDQKCSPHEVSDHVDPYPHDHENEKNPASTLVAIYNAKKINTCSIDVEMAYQIGQSNVQE